MSAPPRIESASPRTRIPLRWLLLLILLLPALWLVVRDLPPPPTPAPADEVVEQLRDTAMTVVQDGHLARTNGAVYAVDIGQLATYAALAGDRELFDPLRQVILNQLLVQREPGDIADGMIAWRTLVDPAPDQLAKDASGTTEALRAAEALWRGVEAFGYEEDRDVVRRIVDAYCRHATPPGETPWMVRNYFNLHPNVWHFITNSFLVDYDPDLLLELADAFDQPAWRDVAERSAQLIGKAQTPAGLLHQMIRPEVATVMPGFADNGLYSLNNVEQISNVLTVAERCAIANPAVARRVLDFAKQRLPKLALYYDATTGDRIDPPGRTAHPGVETWAPLLRLAIKLNDTEAIDAATLQLRRLGPSLTRDSDAPRLYLIGEALLALAQTPPDTRP